MMTYPFNKLIGRPFKVGAFTIAISPTGFIGQVAHDPNLRRTKVFKVTHSSPSRDGNACAMYREIHDEMPSGTVGTDYKELARGMKPDQHNTVGMPVPVIAAPTPLHKEMMIFFAEQKKHQFDSQITDKPPTVTLAEAKAVLAALPNGAVVYITQNHRYFAPVFEMKHRIEQEGGPDAVEFIIDGFNQPWCADRIGEGEGGRQQQDWRLAHVHGPALDIETHANDLATFICGSPMNCVWEGTFSRDGKHGEPCFDTGSMKWRLENGVEGSSQFTNANPKARWDDIYIGARLKNNTTLLWRMYACGGNILLTGGPNADIDKPYGGDWTALERGSPDFSDATNNLFGHHPAGHGYDWADAWRFAQDAIYGDIARRRGIFTADELGPMMNAPVATLHEDGVNSIRGILAHDHSFADGGKEVKLANVRDDYVAEPPR